MVHGRRRRRRRDIGREFTRRWRRGRSRTFGHRRRNPNEPIVIRMCGVGGHRATNRRAIIRDNMWSRRGDCGVPRSGHFRRIQGRRAPTLKVMKALQRSASAKGLIGEVAVGRSVDGEDKRRKVDQHARIRSPDKTTARLFEMGPKAVQRDRQARDVEGMADEDPLTVERNDGSATAQHRKVGIIPHAHL